MSNCPTAIYKGDVKFNTMLCYAKSLESCPTLCDPVDGSPPGSPVLGILQANDLDNSKNNKAAVFSFSIYPGNYHRRKYVVLCELLPFPSDHRSVIYVFITQLNDAWELPTEE